MNKRNPARKVNFVVFGHDRLSISVYGKDAASALFQSVILGVGELWQKQQIILNVTRCIAIKGKWRKSPSMPDEYGL